jgi:hypothetical protein
VSDQTVRYHARKGRLPFDATPGGHRRYDEAEVRTALAPERALSFDAGQPELDFSIDLESPTEGQLTDSMRARVQATAGYHEQRFDYSGDVPFPALMDLISVPGCVRYPHAPHAVGAGA